MSLTQRDNWNQVRRIIVVALAILLSPIIVVLCVVWLILWFFAGVLLNALIWTSWSIRGKDVLFVYSDSLIWHDYLEEHVIPHIRARSEIINWSERRRWNRFSLTSLAFLRFAGSREFNPMAIYFRPFRRRRTFRFYQAFHDWKHGKPEALKRIEDDFFECIGSNELIHTR